ncbi:MAG: hypothetical protein E6K44_07685 [Gammaproteobacteria bacterium]|nr:MAG: hypothetical protein E6K44_07685 [Gammaproteobacteria bacterium]
MTRSAAISCVAIGIAACSHRSVPADPWDPQAAAAYLDHRIEWWMGWSGAARDQGTFCFSCHTAVPYALARPSLRTALAEAAPSAAEHQLMEDVRQRVRLWSATRPFYTDERHGPGKSAQSRGTEAVLSAVMLAWDDARSGRLSADTRAALDNMWAVQQASGPDRGAWAWLDFNLAPWEVPDAQYYGAALAALAVGVAPEDYRSIPQIQELEQAAMPRALEAVRHGRSWLVRNQRGHGGLWVRGQEGFWVTHSLNKRRNPSSNVGLFMSDAATAYAVLALTR